MNVCEQNKDGITREFFKGATRGYERNGWREIRRKLFQVVNTRALSRGQNELVGKFKIVAGDMVSIRGQVMEYTYIPTGIKRG